MRDLHESAESATNRSRRTMAQTNIIQILNLIQVCGPSVTVTGVTQFDNTLESQPPPQIQVQINMKTIKKAAIVSLTTYESEGELESTNTANQQYIKGRY